MEKIEVQSYELEYNLKPFTNVIGLPSSGKTYLLKKLINNIENKDIFIDNKNIKEYTIDYLKNNIAVCLNNFKFKKEYVKEELIYNLSLLNYNEELKYLKLKEISKEFQIDDLLDVKIKYLTLSEKALIKILSILIITPSLFGIDNMLCYMPIYRKKQIIEYSLKNNISILNITNCKEELLFSNNIIIVDNHKVIYNGKTNELYKEEKKLNAAGMKLPFIAELSNGLNYYDLIKNDCYDVEKLIGEIWK